MRKFKFLTIAACLFAGVVSSCNEDMYQIEEESFSSSTVITPLINVGNLVSVTDIDKIQNWAGSGDYRSVLAIQWNTPDSLQQPTGDVTFLAWGYRWDPNTTPTGLDLIRAVAANDPRLFVVITQQWGGWTVKGFGYDGNGDGEFSVSNASLTLDETDFQNGGVYVGSVNDDFDGMTTANSQDLWMGGWYDAYATYWLGDSGFNVPSYFGYSSFLVDGRDLEDESWDAWTFSAINTSEYNIEPQPGQLKAAPANN